MLIAERPIFTIFKNKYCSNLLKNPTVRGLNTIIANVFRCPGLVMDECPRSDVSDKYSWQCSNCKCRLSIRNNFFFFFKIKVAFAQAAPHSVFVGI